MKDLIYKSVGFVLCVFRSILYKNITVRGFLILLEDQTVPDLLLFGVKFCVLTL